MRRMIQVALLLLWCVMAASLAQAQRLDGTLRVTVTDKTGASVEDARVTVTNEASNTSTTATASSASCAHAAVDLLSSSQRASVISVVCTPSAPCRCRNTSMLGRQAA